MTNHATPTPNTTASNVDRSDNKTISNGTHLSILRFASSIAVNKRTKTTDNASFIRDSFSNTSKIYLSSVSTERVNANVATVSVGAKMDAKISATPGVTLDHEKTPRYPQHGQKGTGGGKRYRRQPVLTKRGKLKFKGGIQQNGWQQQVQE